MTEYEDMPPIVKETAPYELWDKPCPNCGSLITGEGFDGNTGLRNWLCLDCGHWYFEKKKLPKASLDKWLI